MSITSFVRLQTLSYNSEFCKSILSTFLSIPARFTSAEGLFEAVASDMFVCYKFRCRRSEAQTHPTSTDICAHSIRHWPPKVGIAGGSPFRGRYFDVIFVQNVLY